MTEIKNIIEQLIQYMNIGEARIEISDDNHRLNIFINEDYLIKKNLPNLVQSFNHISQLLAKKSNSSFNCIDINNYRLERERLITELAKAAARKALMTKQDIILPIMNSYERRLIHTELSMRPDIKTESEGLGKERHVIIKPILE